MTDEIILNELLSTSSNAMSTTETVSVRQFVSDFKAGRYDFKLPFQRKPQWKNDAKSCWVVALLKRHLADPLSISRPATGRRRGVNGGNRARATVDYTDNKFPMVVKYGARNYSFWYDTIPEAHRNSKYHYILPESIRERYLDTTIQLNVRHNLTIDEEIEWYINMNKNQVSHSPGHILNGHICKERDDPFVINLIRVFPSIKSKYEIPVAVEDRESLGTLLEGISGVDIDVMNENDKRDDCVVSLATMLNLLANGGTYDKDGFDGVCDQNVLNDNIARAFEIFHDYEPSEQMLLEFGGKVKNKPYQSRFWNATYLLGAVFYSIAKKKPNVVNTWKFFLSRCVAGTIDETYFKELAAINIGGESNPTRYSKIWEKVVEFVETH